MPRSRRAARRNKPRNNIEQKGGPSGRLFISACAAGKTKSRGLAQDDRVDKIIPSNMTAGLYKRRRRAPRFARGFSVEDKFHGRKD
jgi:hypothetical protein